MSDLKLKPCPFCGSTNLEYIFSGSQGNIECADCHALGPDDIMAADPECDTEAAYNIWNKRIDDEQK